MPFTIFLDKQIELPLLSRLILLIICMITDQTGLHSVLLPALTLVSLLCVDAGSTVALYQ